MKTSLLLLALLCCACAAPPRAGSGFAAAQRIVEQIVARHPGLVRLTIHAVPSGGRGSRIIASNVSAKLGQPSDPEDLAVIASGETVVLREGAKLDVTMPILDADGIAVAATGITLAAGDSADEQELLEQARSIARELTRAIMAAGSLPW